MTTEQVMDLWYNEEFRAQIKNDCRDACRECPCEFKNFVAHVWAELSNHPDDKTIDYYEAFARGAIKQAYRQWANKE